MNNNLAITSIRWELERLKAVLAGGKVGPNDVKLGAPGVTREWVEQGIKDRELMLANLTAF